jgi:uncharacterized GH25 family protein
MVGSTSWADAMLGHVNVTSNMLDKRRTNDTLKRTNREFFNMRALALCLSLVALPASAHEWWIAPLTYQVPAETTITAQLVNGSDFVGNNQPYLTSRFANFLNFAGGKAFRVPGREGDVPALNMIAPAAGLNVIAYQSRNSTVDYKDWETFVSFTEHKDIGFVLGLHAARGFPEEAFREVYSRYSKSLVAVDDGAGTDMRTGLETEIVALTNPFTDDVSGGMTFQLFYQNAVRANVRFEVFSRAPDGTVVQTFYKTDNNGKVIVPVAKGYDYMADAVVIREPSAALATQTDALWETLWANMTWHVPA